MPGNKKMIAYYEACLVCYAMYGVILKHRDVVDLLLSGELKPIEEMMPDEVQYLVDRNFVAKKPDKSTLRLPDYQFKGNDHYMRVWKAMLQSKTHPFHSEAVEVSNHLMFAMDMAERNLLQLKQIVDAAKPNTITFF